MEARKHGAIPKCIRLWTYHISENEEITCNPSWRNHFVTRNHHEAIFLTFFTFLSNVNRIDLIKIICSYISPPQGSNRKHEFCAGRRVGRVSGRTRIRSPQWPRWRFYPQTIWPSKALEKKRRQRKRRKESYSKICGRNNNRKSTSFRCSWI